MFHCIEFSALQDFSKRILVATNLFGRGMDIERVNIVFNYDMPEDSDTYLHRVARAGRFGTKGMMQHSASIWLCLLVGLLSLCMKCQDKLHVTVQNCLLHVSILH